MTSLGTQKSVDLGDGRSITLETGKLAKQADGSVVVRLNDTMLLCTVVSNPEAKDGVDFMPLTVDYREKFASTGRIPGGFFKREARPSEDEILTMRLVDRALRPLFPNDYHADTQVMIQFISGDGTDMPDALACLGASTALALSDVPFAEPVSEVRVARLDGQLVVNPTMQDLEKCDVDMMIAGTLDNIVMVEGEMAEISEEEMVEAIVFGHEVIKRMCQVQLDLAEAAGVSGEKREYQHEPADNEEIHEQLKAYAYQKFYDIAAQNLGKHERYEAFSAVRKSAVYITPEEGAEADEGPAEGAVQLTADEYKENEWSIKKSLRKLYKEAVRRLVLDEGIRLDGRATTDIRPIWSEVGYLPGPHGSAVFTRGETQSLTTLTLGTKMDAQTIDGALVKTTRNFMLHYNFPPFSTGESRPLRGTSRREVGHGNLALRALKGVLPTGDDFPYTIRIVSDILESNGSSSMATVCAGTLAMMDGGVKIKKPVSGIAMGLITDGAGKFAVLSDILGDEDHLGDMDFKVTGTSDGITACQMDIKVDGLPMEVLTQALNQAKEGRLHILGEMMKTIDTPREDYKPHAPRIVSFVVPNESIGGIIGPGGKIIQEIQKVTETVVSIDEVDGVGRVQIASANKENLDKAVKMVKDIAFPPTVEVGDEFEGKVKSIMPYGAFVEILPGIDGLLHISEIEHRRLDRVEDALKEGDVVKFRITGKDPRNGKLKLSRKVLLPKPEGSGSDDRGGRNDRGNRGGGGGRRDDRRDNRGPRNEENNGNSQEAKAPASEESES